MQSADSAQCERCGLRYPIGMLREMLGSQQAAPVTPVQPVTPAQPVTPVQPVRPRPEPAKPSRVYFNEKFGLRPDEYIFEADDPRFGAYHRDSREYFEKVFEEAYPYMDMQVWRRRRKCSRSSRRR